MTESHEVVLELSTEELDKVSGGISWSSIGESLGICAGAVVLSPISEVFTGSMFATAIAPG